MPRFYQADQATDPELRNKLAMLQAQFGGQDPNSPLPMQGPAENDPALANDFKMMQDAGWFSNGNGTPAPAEPTQLGQGNGTVSTLNGWGEQAKKERNQLNALLTAKILSGDLDGASQLAVTPEDRALVEVGYGQKMNRQAGINSNLVGDYQRMQQTGVDRARMEQDRQLKNAQTQAQTELIRANTLNANIKEPPVKSPIQVTDAAGNVRLFTQDGQLVKDLGASGKPTATYEKGVAAKRQMGLDIDTAIRELTEASKDGGWIDKSTGSGIGAARDSVAGFFGKATEGGVASGKLKPIADLVLKMVPRFEGPQSDKDTISYRDASGDIANPNTPNETKKAAAKVILGLMQKRRGQFIGANNAGTEIDGQTSASSNGWKVTRVP